MPWVKFASLTGANAFESCCEKDDIDLFIITRANRLWLCYLSVVILTKIFRKRPLLCLNYAVDENHLEIPEENYYTAIQIVQMLPLVNHPLYEKMIRQNPWIFNLLPNARCKPQINSYYLLKHNASERTFAFGWMNWLNRRIYRLYSRRLAKKFPEQFGEGIILSEGRAKLNQVDHQDIYSEIYRQIEKQVMV